MENVSAKKILLEQLELLAEKSKDEKIRSHELAALTHSMAELVGAASALAFLEEQT